MLYTPEIETFIEYLKTRNKFNKTYEELTRQNIFEQPENKFVFNKDFLETVESIIDEDHYLKDSCNLFLKELIDNIGNGSIDAKLNQGKINKENVFIQLNKYDSNEVLIGISETKESIVSNSRILNINNITKCNKNYVFSKLLQNEICKLSYTDFDNNNHLLPLLNHIYSLYNEIEEVIIIDRYTNLNHQIYNGLIEKSPVFYYYTTKIELASVSVIKRKLKKYKIYNTNDNNLIHQRTLVFNEIVIVFDEDPNNILSRNTWNIFIEYSNNSSIKIKNNTCSQFTLTKFCNN